MNELIKYEIYSYHLVGILAKSTPKNLAEINTYLRKGIISNISDNSENAMFGLFLWVKQATKENLTDFPYPSDDLIREVGLTVAMRRENNLIQALLVSNRIFNSKNNHLKKVISPLLIEGLQYLILEHNYQSENKNSEDTPIIRLNCSKLAYRMSLNGYADEPIIKKWLDDCKNDPLPEVRNIMIDLDSDE